MSEEFEIVNPNNDFTMVQNYALQLCAEKKITHSNYVLYAFYCSISGFNQIKCGYDYIHLNTGISKGAISTGNVTLEEARLIKIKKNGVNKCNQIYLTASYSLPRRELKKIEREEDTNIALEYKELEAAAKNKQSKNISLTPAHQEFVKKFEKKWCDQTRASKYMKNDAKKLLELSEKDVKDAMKYIPVLWSLDDIDKWVRKSDHSIEIFMKEYKSGKLQSHYTKTIHYHKDKQKMETENE